MLEINQQIMSLAGQPEELAKFINLDAKGEYVTNVKLLILLENNLKT